jgi:hypothetical protein
LPLFAAQLRNSQGDASTYNLSDPTEKIDAFLSHSWRDSGYLKYLVGEVAAVAYLRTCSSVAIS